MSDAILQRFLSAQDRLVLQSSDLSLGTIANMVQKEAIDIAPDFQRRERWNNQKKSALIESYLLNIPVPPVYLAEDEYGKYSVVDGKQRITAIHSFLNEEMPLTKLESFTELNGYTFTSLPRDMRNALDVRPYMRVITILKQSDPLLKFEVFTRLNTGGAGMYPQELRNVAFRGQMNDLIIYLSSNQFLRQQLKIKDNKSSGYQLMLDVETVLRFLTLSESWKTFSGDFRNAMDMFMTKHQFAAKRELKHYESRFNRAMNGCESIWGANAFKRTLGNQWRDQFISGMYDAQMLGIDNIDDATLSSAITNKASIIDKTKELFEDETFNDSVREATNQNRKLKYRINSIVDLLKA